MFSIKQIQMYNGEKVFSAEKKPVTNWETMSWCYNEVSPSSDIIMLRVQVLITVNNFVELFEDVFLIVSSKHWDYILQWVVVHRSRTDLNNIE